MRFACWLSIIALIADCTPLPAQESKPPDVRQGDSWIRAFGDRAKRGTLHDAFQNIRGDTGRWSDEPRLLHAPSIEKRPAKTTLDDWFDQLLEKPTDSSAPGDDNWLLLRTRQLDDNDRVWVERIERQGNQFTVVLSEAVWQGRYFKTFTYYRAYGINLGKLSPGQYEAKWIIAPLTFKQFDGDGRPASLVAGRQIDNWPKDDVPAPKEPLELRTKFRVVAETPPKDRQSQRTSAEVGGLASESKSSVKQAHNSAALTRIIDARIDAGLKSASIASSPLASDTEFIRRVHLDLHGVTPTIERVRAFLDDSAADRRARLIDRLLAEPRFAAHLADIWDDHLLPAPGDPRLSRDRLNVWLQEAFETRSWDRITHDLLTASGQRDKDAVVSYLLKGRETLTPAELTDLVSQYFLGMRLNCAQCHDHPFTNWKQSDYWGLAAFFTQIQYTDRRLQKSGLIRDDPAVDIARLENADKLRMPTFLRSEALADAKLPHRLALANWLVSPENPYFARAMVNRMWWQLLGRALVEPVDDMHDDNAASHPELLADLTEHFVASGFDLRYLCRAICNSAAYQRTSMPPSANGHDSKLYSHMAVKVLTPEQLYDSLQVVAPPGPDRKRFEGNLDPRSEFVQFFRSEGDPNPTVYDRGIPQTLRMMNSRQVLSPRNEAAAVRRIVEPGTATEQAISTLYLHVLARVPTSEERKILDDYLAQHLGPREQAYAEIMWGLLNSSEFSLNH